MTGEEFDPDSINTDTLRGEFWLDPRMSPGSALFFFMILSTSLNFLGSVSLSDKGEV